MAEFEISEDQVPPEALAAFSNEASPAPFANEVEIDPVDTLDAAGLFELSKNKMFSPLEYAQQNPDKATNPDIVRKLADTHALVRERGFTFSDLPSVGEAAKGVGHMIAGGAKQIWNYANAFIGVPLAGVAGAVTGQLPTFSEELAQEGQRRMIETAAGTEAAITGLSQLPGRAIGKVVHRAGTISGLGKPYDQQTEQEKSKAFFDDLGKAQTAGEITQGRGGLVGAISGATQDELAAAGKPIRPKEVETLAAGDPLSFVLFGKAFGAAGGAVGRVIPKTGAGAVVIEKAGKAAAAVGGRTIQTAGKLTEFGGAATKLTGKVLPVAGAIGGTATYGPLGTIGGLAAGATAGRAAERIGRAVTGAGEGVAGFGRQVATGVGATPYAQAARDILAASPIVASETLKGATFDLALAAATSESPQETEAAAAFGTVLGGLKGVGRGALKVAQGQIITPRDWGTPKATPAYRKFSDLDQAHSQAISTAAPGQVQRVNAIREFLGDKVQAYLMPDAATMEAALTARGVAPEQAKAAAQSQGMFVGEFPDNTGTSRRVVFLNNADAAPHEAFHGIQDVLGESANQVVDGIVFQEYAPQWESLGQQYAKRLGGDTGNWREVVLDRSGWGNAAAAEKAVRDAANKIEAETGAVPTPKAARDMAEGVLSDARRNQAGWRDILTTEEATAEANRYLARELAAENFDAAFKHLGAGLAEGNTLPEKLARVVARTAAFMGAEPLAGVKTEGLQIEPRRAVTEAVTGLGRASIEPIAAREVRLQKEQAAILQEQEAKNIQAEAIKTLAAAEDKQAKAKTVEEKRRASQELVQARTEKLRADTAAKTAKTKLTEARTEKVRAATEREAQKGASKPTTPETTATAEGVKGIAMAEELAARDPAQAEVLRKISTAISTGQALKIDYRSAPGEPAGSPNISREARREIIEAFRDMPESVRPLWEKTSIPFRLEPTKSKGIQILTYSPEVFAANARKLSQFISDTGTQRLSPYEIDPATKTFTTDGWQRLYNDVNIFTANQRAGGTGSGVPLELPANAAEMRVSVPPINEAALTPLPQATADFINVIFHLPPPETPRVSRKGRTPGNIVAQEIAHANEPLIGPRVTEPGRPRSEQEFKGFEGRRILEVNPLRAELEKAATKDIKFPSLIETNQRLNLEHLVDATPVPEVRAALPITETLRAGFLPKSIEQTGREVLAMTPDEFTEQSRLWKGGLTSEAKRIGLGAQSKEDVALLLQFASRAKDLAAGAMKARDLDTAISMASVGQLWREAYESATGTGGIGEALRKDLGEAYVPPFPLDK